jgi:hypothetical protein
MVGTETAVGQGLLQQSGLAKGISQANLQLSQTGRNSG